jgi:hypothetical protein
VEATVARQSSRSTACHFARSCWTRSFRLVHVTVLPTFGGIALTEAILIRLRKFLHHFRTINLQIVYTVRSSCLSFLLRLDMLQLLGLMNEVVRVCLRRKPPLSWLLDKVLVALFFRESDGVLFRLEVEVCSLHEISRGLPSH